MESAAVSPTKLSTPYGRACINCAKAKCKCIPSAKSTTCERCHRLRRECHPSESLRKRNTKRTTSRTAHLEEKLDGILTLLQSNNDTPKDGSNDDLVEVEVSIDAHIDESQNAFIQIAQPSRNDTFTQSNIEMAEIAPTVSTASSIHQDHNISEDTTPDANQQPAHCNHIDSTTVVFQSIFEPSIEDAEQYLSIFRTQLLPRCPLLHIPASTSARKLRQERPFLFLSIMAVSSKSNSQRLALGRDIKQMAIQGILSEDEHSLDTLLGLIVFLTWGHDQFLNSPHMSRFMSLTISIVFELRLNRPLLKEPSMVPNLDPHGCPRARPSSTRTLEERRTLLACVLLSSIASTHFLKMDPIRWTPYTDECVRVLSEEQECPADSVLVAQLQLQMIVLNVPQISWKNPDNDYHELVHTSLSFYLKALHGQLGEAKAKLSPENQNNKNILTYIYNTEISINQVALFKKPIRSDGSGFEHLDCLCNCLTSVKSWFDLFFSSPPSSVFQFPFPIFAQLSHCLIVLYRLTAFEDPSWDKKLVRKTLDIIVIVNQLIYSLRQVSKLFTESSGGDMFAKSAFLFERVKMWLSNHLSIDDIDPSLQTELLDGQSMTDMMPMDLFDDSWLSGMLLSMD